MKNKPFCLRTVIPAQPLSFSQEKCNGCNRCVDACPSDLLLPGEDPGTPPRVAYPDECWYCGSCVMECPNKAVSLSHPLMNQARWVEKSSLLEKEEE